MKRPGSLLVVRQAIYGLAALEAGTVLIFAAFCVLTSAIQSSLDLYLLFYFGALPLGALCVALAVFHLAKGGMPRAAAAAVIMAPMLGLSAAGMDEAVSAIRQSGYASGQAYFDTRPAQALAAAVMRGDAAAAAVAARSTDVNQAGKWGKTFLGLALSKPVLDVATAKALLDAGADPNQDESWPLQTAISRGDAAMLALLLDAGADPSRVGRAGRPVFFEALDLPDMLAALLRPGVPVDAVDREGRTALMRAVSSGRWPAVTLLLAAGASTARVASDGAGLALAAVNGRHIANHLGQPIPPELLAVEARLRNPTPVRSYGHN